MTRSTTTCNLNSTWTAASKPIHDLKRIVPIDSEESWAITGSSVYRFFYDGYIARIREAYKVEADNLSLITAYENIAVLNDSLSLICLDAGFILHNSHLSKRQTVGAFRS